MNGIGAAKVDTAAQEAMETAAQTAREAARGDMQAVRKLSAAQTSPKAAQTTRVASSPGPAATVAISATARQVAASSGDVDHDGDSK